MRFSQLGTPFLIGALFLAFSFVPHTALADTIVSSDIVEDTTWTKAGSPYLVQDWIIVDQNATLSIEPGVVAQFDSFAAMDIQGRLLAQGTANEPISFTSDSGGWYGIYFENPNASSFLDHAVIKYAYRIEDFYSKDLSISNTSIEDGDYGIDAYGSHLSLKNFSAHNISNDAIDISYGSDAKLENVTLKNVGAGVEVYVDSKADISNLFIDQAQDEAIGVYDSSRLVVRGSHLSNGSGDGIQIYTGGSVDMQDSIISGFAYGTGIADYGSSYYPANSLSLTHNEIKDNGTGLSLYSDNSSYSISNNAIHDNTSNGLESYGIETVDVSNNFWGDPSGPYNDPGNLSGKGNAIFYVSENTVTFSPWLSSWETPSDPCAAPGACASSVLFLPGIEASRLYRPDYASGTDTLWEPNTDSDVQDLYMHPDGTSVRHDIYTKDVVDEAYGTLNIYKSFLHDLDIWKNVDHVIDNYRVVPYDWRVSLDDLLDYGREMPDGRLYYAGDLRATSTPYIIQELRRLAATSKTGKVTIVAHSNGGLVAKALLKRLQDARDPLLDKIDSIIMVAVPQAGTPMAIGALLHGHGQAIPFELFHPFLSPAVAREFAHNVPMAHHLLPSGAYFAGVGGGTETPVVTFRDGVATRIFIDRYDNTIDNAIELRDFLLGAEGRMSPAVDDLASPSILRPNLVTYGESVHASLDAWMPPASTTVHEIAGWGEDTVAGVTYDTDRKCVARVLWACTKYIDALRYTPDMVIDGDGTVVAPSALAMSTSTENVRRWWLDLEDFNATDRPTILLRNINHANILEVPELRSFIRNIITASSTSLLPRYVRASIPPYDNEMRLRFFLHSPLTLSATDATGNEISTATSTIPNARYRRFGEVQYISVPAGAAPTLRLDGVATGSFTLEVQEMRGNTIIATTTFLGIPNATTTTAQMSFPDGTIAHASPFTVDADGDGDVDITLNPRVGETVVPDTTPPEFIITFATSTNALAFIGTDNAGTTTITATTTYPALKKKEKEPHGIATTTVIARDEAGNTIALVYTKKLPSPKGRDTIALQGIAYNGATTTIASTTLSYKWRIGKDGLYKLFASRLKTFATSTESHYRPKKNVTVIMTKPRDLDDDDNDDGTDTRPTKERLPGMIIPRMVTNSGEIKVIY